VTQTKPRNGMYGFVDESFPEPPHIPIIGGVFYAKMVCMVIIPYME
jgi:hypothetical protein